MVKIDRMHIEKWYENRRELPDKEFVLTFNLINGDIIKAKVLAKDDFDVKQRLDKFRIDIDKNKFNQSLSIYRDHIIWCGIEEII